MRPLKYVCALLFLTSFGASAQVSPDPANRVATGEFRIGVSYLGVGLTDIDVDRAKILKLGDPRGVEVRRVEEGSPADKAGIKIGDVLLTYNGQSLLGAEQLGRLVRETPRGRKVKIQLWRAGQSESLTVITEGRRDHTAEDRPLLLQVPTFQGLIPPDLPSPLLMWKSSVLGIICEPVDGQLAEYFGIKQGVLVRSVLAGSAAGKAGLKAGDVLTKVGDRSVSLPRDITGSLLKGQRQTGKPVPVVLTRDHREMVFNITPDETPDYPPFTRSTTAPNQ